jgi:transcriptional regulator with XRE-family HTH domain
MTRSPGEHVLRADVARRLFMRRTWLRLSQQEVADKAGVSRNFISAIERSAQGLDAWRLHQIADALGTTLSWLVAGPDDEVTAPAPGAPADRFAAGRIPTPLPRRRTGSD